MIRDHQQDPFLFFIDELECRVPVGSGRKEQ
jgi:hypothetical protein